ncbi:pre-mRNA-splicing ATP-dependent RNA helicase prp28-like [Vanessa cardui]|uniref:pre-mRNA-splicing ATP-dependent RNA helicase prp28-like n=1 Tax=Vanessa cardui TaxID=171605 RepID=UPI001F13767B|nr:pre-mRNA-splicing ATP-dependent RNA helicase prp28-like [Vanessa cardui]
MEERLLAIMGILAVEGQASIEELGFYRSQSSAQEVVAIDDREYFETVDEPSTSQPPAPPAPPAPSSSPAPPPPPASPSPPVVLVAPGTPRRRRTAAPRTPDTPQSAGSSGRPRRRARRRRQAPTPFDRAATEFVAIETRRLEAEETRSRLQHERDLRALELQHERDMRAFEVDHERNDVLRALVNIAQACLDYYRSRDNTEPLNIE